MPDMGQCDPEVYENGKAVMVISNGPDAAGIEEWVLRVRELSGQPVDWHYVGGAGVVKALGDTGKVRSAMERLMPELDRMSRKRYDREFRKALGGEYEPGSAGRFVDE